MPATEEHARFSKIVTEISGSPPGLVIVSSDLWWSESIASMLRPYEFAIETADGKERAVALLRDAMPQAAIVHSRAPDDLALDTLAGLRRALGAENAILLIPDHPLTREQRLAVLKAGAWDYMRPPIDGEELALKLHTYGGAARVAVGIRRHTLLDEDSGLYNLRGILRGCRELSNAAKRHSRPLGCAVFAQAEEAPTDSEGPAPVDQNDHSREIAVRLTTRGRDSDIIGRLSDSEYVVVAPGADPRGIVEMASRLIANEDGESQAGIRLRAGCTAVSNLALESIEPAELIARATFALRSTRNAAPGSIQFLAGAGAMS